MDAVEAVHTVVDPHPCDAAGSEVNAEAPLRRPREERRVPLSGTPQNKAAIGEGVLLGRELFPGPGDIDMRLECVHSGRVQGDGEAGSGAFMELELEGLFRPRELEAVPRV